jgi:methionyl-tRNA formyltransferase
LSIANLYCSFRGPAPIQHTILAKELHSGVTLQSLDDKIFDHGIILAQTPEPWVPIPKSCTYSELHEVLAPLGAQILVEGLRNGVHVPPLKEIPFPKRSGTFLHAPKITSADRKIIWGKKGNLAPGIRALGRMWSEFYVDATNKKRCIFEDVEESEETFPSSFVKIFQGDNQPRPPTAEELAVKFVIVEDEQEEVKAPLFYVENGDAILIGEPGMCSGMRYFKSGKQRLHVLKVKNITLEGQGSKPAAVVMRSLNRKGKWELKVKRELNHYNTEVSGYHWTVGNFIENAKDTTE